jgi:tetratricopeptide (TPR) repeat protein
VQAFVDRAKRQLLVALHETTLGKPFEEIVEDEYRQIEPEEARLLYLDICTLHQFGVGVRAGLISRVSGVRFEDFQQRLFRPLDGVVDCRTDPYGADRLYRTRHPHVAGIVFDRVLSDREERLNQIIRIMSGMNIDYTTDFEAFRQIIRYRNVIEAFPSHAHGLVIYKAAADATDEDPYVLQQLGLYELNQNGGSMVRAIEHLEKAEALAPHDPSIRHSVANLLRHRALRETNPLLRSQYRQRALSRLSKARATESKASYEYNTRLQLLVDDLKDQLADVSDARDDKAAQRVVVEKVREIEQELNVAHHEFPDDEHILATEAEYRKTIADRPRALKALQNAFTANPRLEWIAVRLAAFHLDSGDVPAAKRVLETVCTENPGAKEAHLRLGRLYAESDNEDERKRALQHFRSSFSNGDANYDAQFWYARQLFVERQYGESERYFTQLANTPRIGGMRVHVRGIILDEAGKPRRFRGRIAKKEASYLFISTDDFARDVFAHASETPAEVWVHLRNNQAITFELGFVARGPIGRAVMPEE